MKKEINKFGVVGIALCAVMSMQLLSGCSKADVQVMAEENTPSKAVVAMSVASQPYIQNLEYKGFIMAKEEKKLSFGLSGKVKTIYVEKGQQVKTGEVIAEMDTENITASMDSQNQNIRIAQNSITQIYDSTSKIDSNIQTGEISLESLQLTLSTDELNLQKTKDTYEGKISTVQMNYDNAKEAYDKTKVLYDAGAVSMSEFENVQFSLDKLTKELGDLQISLQSDIALQEANVENTKNKIKQQEIAVQGLKTDLSNVSTQIESANIKLRQAEIGAEQSGRQLDETVLTSPIDGYVEDILVKSGENTSFSAPVVKIISTQRVVNIGVPIEDYGFMKTGMTVNMEAENIAFTGTISSVALSPSEGSRSYSVEITPNNHDLPIGTLIEVFVPIKNTEETFIPLQSIITTGGISYVYSLDKNENDTYVARRTEIEAGNNPIGDKVLVTNIPSGTLIVSEGVKSIKENDIVTIVE